MKLWEQTKSWFTDNADQMVCVSIPDDEAKTALKADETYVGVWLTHSFLKKEVVWLKKRYPAAHVSVRLDVAGETTTLTRLARPAEGMVGPGVWANFPVTGLIPYRGGTIEVEAGLIALEQASFLGAAVDVLSDFSSLVTSPLSEALGVAGKVANGVQTLLEAGEGEVLLGLHQAFSPAGGGGDNVLAPGYLAIVGAPHRDFESERLLVKNSRLHLSEDRGSSPLEGYDYLLFRIESRRERDDWRFERFEALIRKAITAHFAGDSASFERYRNDVLAEVLNSPDLTRPDRNRVALAIKDELELATEVSNNAVGDVAPVLAEIVERHAVPLDHAMAMGNVTLQDLIVA